MPKIKKPLFRINRKKFGLTYAQCDVSKEALLEQLQKVGGSCDYTISQEKHKDGGLHLHAWVKFEEVLQSVNPRVFDLPQDDKFHPEINNPGSGWESYVVKAGDYITNHYEADPWVEAFRPKVSSKDAMALLSKKRPRDVLLNYDKIESALKRIKKEERTWKTVVEIHWGVSGAGKTHQAHEQGASFIQHDGKYFTDFEGDIVCWDEFEDDQLSESLFKRICDKYPLTLWTKGGKKPFLAKKLIFTSNTDPRTWYGWTTQISRRVDKIIHYARPYDPELHNQ